MRAQTVQLRVLGTWDYYQRQIGKRTGPSKQLQGSISLSLNQFASARLPTCKMDFGFDTFPKEFSWSLASKDDKEKILDAVKGIHPLFT